MIKVIFMGTPDFSAVVLNGLLTSEQYQVMAAVTQPDRLVGRKKEVRMPPVKELAQTYGLPVYQPEKLSGSPELEKLLQLDADGIVTAAYGQFLPADLLAHFDFAVNVHASLLPKYRGGAPIHHALMMGDREAGVTIMEMVQEMDAGDMIAKRAIPIEEADNVGSLFDKLALVGRDLLLDTLPAYLKGEIVPVPQKADEVTFAPNISPEQEEIDWSGSAVQVHNHIRGLSPWPVAYTWLGGSRFKILEAERAEGSGRPGEIIAVSKKELRVAAGQGALSLKTVQPAGKPRMPIADFLNGLGRDLAAGDRFGR